jgi:hypothetical protein
VRALKKKTQAQPIYAFCCASREKRNGSAQRWQASSENVQLKNQHMQRTLKDSKE